jgi:LmbE family N-acetylglucosaminyl deacetylase
MDLVVNEHFLGTPESEWAGSLTLRNLAPLDVGQPRRLVVVAPHPDDEVFGAAGLMQAMGARRTPIEVLAVTDGEASHPIAVADGALDLRSLRDRERATALRRLGWSAPAVTRLGLPDGGVSGHLHGLTATLSALLCPGDLCLAPWWHDGHPDHDACGRAALAATTSTGATLAGYLVWAWHWATPRGPHLPWVHCRRFDLSRRQTARKRWATAAFVSQTKPLGPDHERVPLLPSPLLRRYWRPYEVFVSAMDSPS